MAEFSGVVVAGARLGRKIGFPTLNLSLSEKLVELLRKEIGFGVFICNLQLDFPGFDLRRSYSGVMHFGPKGDGVGAEAIDDANGIKASIFCEIHVLDFAHDVYGANGHVLTGMKIRDVKKFATFADLKAQIFADVEFVRGVV